MDGPSVNRAPKVPGTSWDDIQMALSYQGRRKRVRRHSSRELSLLDGNSMLAQILGPDGIVIAVILVVVLFVGGRKIPDLARSLGGARNDFKKGAAEAHQLRVVAAVTIQTTAKDAAGIRVR